jgi:uncharacterized protein (TIRG00374 family)
MRCQASYGLGFRVAALGKYYDNITPFGSGGQPFQFMFLRKRKVPAGVSSSLPIAGFISMQLGFIIISIFVFIFGSRIIDSAALQIPAAVGFVFYTFIPLMLVLFAVMPKTMSRLIGFVTDLGAKIHLIKCAEDARRRVFGMLVAFRDGLTSIVGHRMLTINLVLLSLIYQISLCSIPYFVLKMFGSDLTYLSVTCMTVYVYLCVSFVPTPGNSGVAEGSFYTLFAVLGEGGHLFWAMLLWRFFCYWAYILTGFVVLWINAAENRRNPSPPCPPNPHG